MISLAQTKKNATRQWLCSLAAGFCLTLAILILLSFAHRKPNKILPISEGSGIRLETVDAQEESIASSTPSDSPNLSALLPYKPPETVSPIAIESPPVEVSVDLSQMLEWRYSYKEMGSRSLQAGSFGVSDFSEVDQTIENIIIPPKLFPDDLIDAGITEGRVVVKLLIDEKGHAEVKQVLSATHPTLVPIVVEAMNRSIYSIPVRDGRPTKSMINRTVVFNADPDHVAKRRSSNGL